MFRGFYNLTSSMVSENRNLNVISNNMTNVSTPGYKSEKYLATTFSQELVSRAGNRDGRNSVIGQTDMLKSSNETYTNFENVGSKETGNPLDFAIEAGGFFRIQTNNGEVYTRNGSFVTDEEGYLFLKGQGRVMGLNGPIQLPTDNISVMDDGSIFAGNQLIDQFAIVDFNDYNELMKNGEGVFIPNPEIENVGQPIPVDPQIRQGAVERSNVDALEEMTSMMTSQRSIQSSAQLLKIYDQLMSKISNDIGKI